MEVNKFEEECMHIRQKQKWSSENVSFSGLACFFCFVVNIQTVQSATSLCNNHTCIVTLNVTLQIEVCCVFPTLVLVIQVLTIIAKVFSLVMLFGYIAVCSACGYMELLKLKKNPNFFSSARLHSFFAMIMVMTALLLGATTRDEVEE